MIFKLTDLGKYYFLSRPRRFGKSLLLSTLEKLFLGNKKLFEGLWIENHWNWEKTNPIIRLDFSEIDHKNLGLKKAIQKALFEIAEKYQVTLQSETIALLFRELIFKLSHEGKVVLLFDEYDKPVTDHLTELEKAYENREILKDFYSVIKA